MTHYIFITGGVVSSLGKGLSSAALGVLLQARNYKVKLRKLDPYLNVDAGTISPFQHGEVFVTEDGMEADLDLGHYERFTGLDSNKSDIITTGKIYQTLIQKERKGDYLGGTVQVIPHVTNLIKDFITKDTQDVDFVLCEIGGTVGDIEGLPFFESIRQLSYEVGKSNSLFVHLTLLPYIATAQELKTKPTQHSVKSLCSLGIQPDILLCRSDHPIPQKEKEKIALFCNVSKESVIEAPDVDNIYQIPVIYHKNNFDQRVLDIFNLPALKNEKKESFFRPDLSQWEEVVNIVTTSKDDINIAIIGKYTELSDAYKSIIESLSHAGIANKVNVKLQWVDSRKLKAESLEKELYGANGILVPGGFGNEGIKGKLLAIKHARINKIPILGICLGMQLMLIEFAQNVLSLENASSTEFGECKNPIIGIMDQWYKSEESSHKACKNNIGGTMRIGSYPCQITAGTLAHSIYGIEQISERHRHRYEANIQYKEQFEKHGLFFTGLSLDGKLPEIVEVSDHPWYLGVQFHPEFKSKLFEPHPIFVDFVKASIKNKL